MTNFGVQSRIKVGIVGTGYAASKRADAIKADERAQLKSVVGHSEKKTASFAQSYDITKVETWQELVKQSEIECDSLKPRAPRN